MVGKQKAVQMLQKETDLGEKKKGLQCVCVCIS